MKRDIPDRFRTSAALGSIFLSSFLGNGLCLYNLPHGLAAKQGGFKLHPFILAFAVGATTILFAPLSLVTLVGIGLGALIALTIPRLRYAGKYYAILAGAGLGILYTAAHVDYWLDMKLPSSATAREMVIEGEIVSIPRRLPGLMRIEVAPTHPLDGTPGKNRGSSIPGFYGRVRLNCFDCTQDFETGEVWNLRARLRGIHGLANPHLFDYERWAFQHRLVASGTLLPSDDNRRISEPSAHPVSPALRAGLNHFLEQVLCVDCGRGIIQAISLGNRNNIDSDHWRAFQRTGTGHLVAISGLHVSLVFTFLYGSANLASRLCPWLLRRIPSQRLAALIALPPTIYYAWLAGFSLPTQRAVTMLAVFYIAFLFGRRVLGWHTFAIALLAVLLVDPLAPLSQGTWLSFGAVAAIILYASRSRHAPESDSLTPDGMRARVTSRVRRTLSAWVGVQIAISLVIVPLAALFFGELAIASPVVNLFAIPYFSVFVVPPALLGVFSWLLGAEDLAAWLVTLAGRSVTYLQGMLLQVSALEYIAVPARPVDVARIILLLAVISGLRSRIPGKPTVIVALILIMSVGDPWHPAPGEFVVTVLDVGQGLATVVRTRNHTMVFDTGVKYGDSYDMGSIVVNPFLKTRGVVRLDKLVISHGDRDHAGGVDAVLGEYPGAVVMSSEYSPNYPGMACTQGMAWVRDNVRFDVLWPDDVSDRRHNDRSCVILVSSESGRALLTGDIEAKAERRLVRRYQGDLYVDLLVVPHHGSKTSSTRVFLSATEARMAVLSRGLGNPFRHPHPRILERLRRMVPELFDTALDGAVSVFFTRQGTRTEAFRRKSRAFWRSRPPPVSDL